MHGGCEHVVVQCRGGVRGGDHGGDEPPGAAKGLAVEEPLRVAAIDAGHRIG